MNVRSFSDETDSVDVPWAAPRPPVDDDTQMVAVAWLGRTSTEDSQDPTLSLPRQLRKCRTSMPPNWVIVAHYYDVESGRKDLDQRGRGNGHEQFDIPIPRDGGIQDLLAAAKRPDRPFAVVICESIERVARRTYFGTKIEYELEQSGVTLCAADEPISAEPGARRATPTLTRRVKQAVAEWYVLQMLELSAEGTIEHIRQGWNIGKPPYGYEAEKVPHPVPAKRAEGRTKHRLVPHPVQGPVVTKIFEMRAVNQIGYDAIADMLNRDPVRHPAPEPCRPSARIGRWTGSAVREVLLNPKYTGYMVYNRRDVKNGNRYNPRSEWIWSPHPVHEPLVTKEMYDAVAPVAKRREASRSGSGMNSHPATKRTYPLRSYIQCDIAGHRLWGKERKNHVYYVCERDRRQHLTEEWFRHHPPSIWLRGDTVEECLQQFFSERVFGPHRRELLEAELGELLRAESAAAATTRNEAETLKAEIDKLKRRQHRLIDELEVLDDETSAEDLRELRAGIQRRFTELSKQITAKRAELEALPPVPSTSALDDLALIDELPTLAHKLDAVPEPIRRALFDAYNLQIRYHQPTRKLTIKVHVTGRTLTTIQEATATAQKESGTNSESGPDAIGVGPAFAVTDLNSAPHGTDLNSAPPCTDVLSAPHGTDVLSAPGRIRTCDHRIRSASDQGLDT